MDQPFSSEVSNLWLSGFGAGAGWGRLSLEAKCWPWACFSSFPGVTQPVTWLRAEQWNRLLTSADTGRGSRSQPDTSWQPHLHKSLIV